MNPKRNLISVIVFSTILSSIISCNILNKKHYAFNSVNDAIAYNDLLIDEEIKVIDQIDALDDSFNTYDPEKIETALKETEKRIKESKKNVKKIGKFDGDDSFKQSLLTLIKLFESHVENEYTEMLEICQIPMKEYTSDNEKKFNELYDKIYEEYEKDFNTFSKIQERFAEKYGFDLQY